MKSLMVALLATAMMGSAFAQSTPPAPAPAPAPAPVATVPGAQGATAQSHGDMTTFAVVGGVALVGVVAAAASGGGGSDHNGNTPGGTALPPPTGTTGTTGTTN